MWNRPPPFDLRKRSNLAWNWTCAVASVAGRFPGAAKLRQQQEGKHGMTWPASRDCLLSIAVFLFEKVLFLHLPLHFFVNLKIVARIAVNPCEANVVLLLLLVTAFSEPALCGNNTELENKTVNFFIFYHPFLEKQTGVFRDCSFLRCLKSLRLNTTSNHSDDPPRSCRPRLTFALGWLFFRFSSSRWGRYFDCERFALLHSQNVYIWAWASEWGCRWCLPS